MNQKKSSASSTALTTQDSTCATTTIANVSRAKTPVTPRAEKRLSRKLKDSCFSTGTEKSPMPAIQKCCGGRTELFSTCWQDRNHDYLQSVNDPWCDLSRLPEEERQRILKSVMKDYDRTTTPEFPPMAKDSLMHLGLRTGFRGISTSI